ncbi:BA75_00849T0 [Komagataella pastoris]|uniref:DNA replication complex GINS protein PSF2 n=1 Tax=Komagataella pastoris TaxID=4922 RepID=A0A1B2J7M1_PICPA|nr:BA75_00849T0 [Komagataella pastoris]
MKRAEVPLWLGLILKQQDRCNIVTPSWLSINFLKKAYQEEVTYTTRFFRMPWNWLEISKMILDKAPDDMTEPPHQIRALIQDLREVRLIKARRGLKELNESYMQLDNLSLMEINELRPMVVGVMDQLRKLQVGTNEDEEVSDEEAPLSYDI